MKISVTLLSSYLYCSRKLFLEKVLKLEEPPKESLVMGSIRHEIYDNINKNEEFIVKAIEEKVPLGELNVIYRQKFLEFLRKAVLNNKKRLDEVNLNMLDAYKKSYPYVVEESVLRSSNIFNFIEENNIFGKELWEKLTPKIISELRVESEDLKLKGIIDQIHIYEDSYVPFELKTGKMPYEGVWPSHRIQLAAYSMLLQEHFNKEIKEGFVYYLDSKEKRHIAINPFMREEVNLAVNNVINLLESSEVPDFCDNKNKCKSCGLKQTCYNEGEVNNLLKAKMPAQS